MSGPHLLRRIDVFLKEASMPPSVFGRNAIRDPRFVMDLRTGREPSAEVTARVDAFMSFWRSQREAGLVEPVGDRRSPPRRLPKLSDLALRMARRDPAKAVELLRIAVERVQATVHR